MVPTIAQALRTARLRRIQRRVAFVSRSFGFWAEQLDHARGELQSVAQGIAAETGDVGSTDVPATESDTTVPVDPTLPAPSYDTSGIDGTSTVPGVGDAPPATTPADTSTPATTTTSTPATTTTSTPAPAPAAAALSRATVRRLFTIFDEQLNPEDFTDDWYPRVRAVNDALPDTDPEIDQDTLREVFDRYLHDRLADGEISPPARWTQSSQAAAAARVDAPQNVLEDAFKTLGPEDMTPGRSGEAQAEYPKVSEVVARLPAQYKAPDRAAVHKAYDAYRKKQG